MGLDSTTQSSLTELMISEFNKNVLCKYLIFFLPYPFFTFLHPAFCSRRLTCTNYISGLPCPPTPTCVWPTQPWHKIRGREDDEVSVCACSLGSLPVRSTWVGSYSGWRSMVPIQSPLHRPLILFFQVLLAAPSPYPSSLSTETDLSTPPCY
jgi:hypothetical protein